MSVDFADAASRHWKDAELLHQHRRWPNADQLYGLAAECGLKAVMQGLGMALTPDGRPQQDEHRVHIDNLWSTFSDFASGANEAVYAALLTQPSPFADWSIHQRYWSSNAVTPNRASSHRAGAQKVRQVLNKAQLDGRI